MTQDTSPVADAVADDLVDEDFETIGDYHRMAAHHFQAAAKHHLAAAAADDEGDDEANAGSTQVDRLFAILGHWRSWNMRKQLSIQ
jgi:hypothetical protein